MPDPKEPPTDPSILEALKATFPEMNLRALVTANPLDLIHDLQNENVMNHMRDKGEWYGRFGNTDTTAAGQVYDFFAQEPDWYRPEESPEYHDANGNPIEAALDFFKKKMYQKKMDDEIMQSFRDVTKTQMREEEDELLAKYKPQPRQGTTTVERFPFKK